MKNKLEIEEVREQIKKAFINVKKEGGIGVRESLAMDDYQPEDKIREARELDIEENWTEIPESLFDALGLALAYTDKIGFKFLLPAAMIAMLDDKNGYSGDSVAYSLYMYNRVSMPPHSGDKEYVDYLKSISPEKIAEYFDFNTEQIHAIALFLCWWMQIDNSHIFADYSESIDSIAKSHKSLIENSILGYTLTLDEAVSVFNEECRIFSDWLRIGKENTVF